MALPELTKKKVETVLTDYCNKSIPPHVKDKVRLTFEFRGKSTTLFEDRPVWNDPSRWTHVPVAQFRFDLKTLQWRLYCCDRNSKWHAYLGTSTTRSFESLLAEVDLDLTGIFWG